MKTCKQCAAAREVLAHWTIQNEEQLIKEIATALRKAAADERELARERAAQIAETHVGYHVNGVAHSIAAAIRSDGCNECLACRARTKGGATSVPASGIHERAEGHPKSCTCSYCEVGR